MTPSSTVEPPRDARRRRRRRFLTAALLVALSIGFWWLYGRASERSRVLAAIEAAGGQYLDPVRFPTGTPWISRVIATAYHSRRDDYQFEVFLNGEKFDDAWLTQQGDLRSIPIRELVIANTRLSREAVLRLIGDNRLQSLIAPGIPLTDEDARRIGAMKDLTHLNLMQTEFTDTGLTSLRPVRFRTLNLAGTHVTPEALQKELAGAKLQYLWLDGRQFTPALAAQLSQMTSLTMLALIGPDVTDGHLKLLESMPNVTYFRIEQTTVSDDAVATLRAARPAPAFVEVPRPEEVLAKWRVD